MFKKKSENDSEKELSVLSKKVDKLEKELERLERLEKGLAHNELVLAKKIADMNELEEELKKLVSKHELDDLKKELKKLEEHEEVLVENTKFMREIINELGKVKESHKQTRRHVMAKEHVSKSECEERFGTMKEALKDLEYIRATHKKKVGKNEIELLRKDLHDKMSQLEYQNKLLMKYLKRVDEILQKKT